VQQRGLPDARGDGGAARAARPRHGAGARGAALRRRADRHLQPAGREGGPRVAPAEYGVRVRGDGGAVGGRRGRRRAGRGGGGAAGGGRPARPPPGGPLAAGLLPPPFPPPPAPPASSPAAQRPATPVSPPDGSPKTVISPLGPTRPATSRRAECSSPRGSQA